MKPNRMIIPATPHARLLAKEKNVSLEQIKTTKGRWYLTKDVIRIQ